jgi:LacI family transcriptional regulator
LKALELLKARNVPIVTIDQRVRDPSVDSVRIDNIQAARDAVNHLIENGYRRIGIVAGPKSSTTANDRLTGYRQALQEADIALDHDLERHGPFIEATGQLAAQHFLDLDFPVDAIFATNNRQTAGVYHVLISRKQRIPQDVALVGFDQVSWDIPGKNSITTVMQPGYELGRAAASRLIQRLQQPGSPRQDIILPHQLVIRSSSRSPGSHHSDDTETLHSNHVAD